MSLKNITDSLPQIVLTTSLILASSIVSADQNALQECVMEKFNNADGDLTLTELRELCSRDLIFKEEIQKINVSNNKNIKLGVISRRILNEKQTKFQPYVITPHKLNYILPAYTTNAINKDVFSSIDGYQKNLSDLETFFQISLKVPLNESSLFIEGDALYLGFTLQAWWQIYAKNISKPFRETNYQPELFYLAPLAWHPFEGNTGFFTGIEHQSNGRSQDFSRSWNRVYGGFLFEKDNFALSLKPWIRLSEDVKKYPSDPSGDDNPNIGDYMGHFELAMAHKWDNFELSLITRRNFDKDKGAAQIGFTFPLWGNLRGFATVFSGYGDSLIDYNYKQTRYGLGIALTNIL